LKRTALVLAAGLAALAARGQEPPPGADDLLDALLSGLGGFRDLSEAELQQEVAEVGGVAFRRPVPLDYMDRSGLARYLRELFDSEYPPERASADARTLTGFDLLPEGTDLRSQRERLLLENVVGFYDERPGKQRLYAVSAERRLTPANQMILAHELRHALQDQYLGVHELLPAEVGDFDDRRLALMSLLEGDATLVMERFLLRRLPVAAPEEGLGELGDLAVPEAALPGVAPVLRDHVVQPYLVGRAFVQALWTRGGWSGVQSAWQRPPESMEQVLHPEKYFQGEAPAGLDVGAQPRGGRLINEGVLGELLIGTLLGDAPGAAVPAGWAGDRFRVWDVRGRTLLAWRSRWDTPGDAREFLEALQARFVRARGAGRGQGAWTRYAGGSWTWAISVVAADPVLVASDDAAILDEVRVAFR
jgi:hypothetical protein